MPAMICETIEGVRGKPRMEPELHRYFVEDHYRPSWNESFGEVKPTRVVYEITDELTVIDGVPVAIYRQVLTRKSKEA